MNELFRKEALNTKKTAPLGEVLVAFPPSLTFLSLACVVLTAIIVIFLSMSELARKQTTQGYLVPDRGLIKVMPPFPGTVIERRIHEGDAVTAGDILFIVASNRGTRNTHDIDATLIAEAHKQRHSFVERLDQTRRTGALEAAALERETSGLERELAQSEIELSVQKQRLSLSSDSLDRHRRLVEQGHLPEQLLRDQEREYLALAALISGLERNRLTLIRQLDTTRSRIELSALETAVAVADYDGRIAEMDQRLAELDARAGYAVRAPVAGIATNVTLEPGQTVTGEVPLLALLPLESSLEALIYIPTRAAGFVKPGAQVRLRYDAFPYQRFGLHHGTIQRISKSILTPNEMEAPFPLAEPVYTAFVVLERQHVRAYGDELALKPGMLLQADIVLDRQSLLGWLLDPLYAATGSL